MENFIKEFIKQTGINSPYAESIISNSKNASWFIPDGSANDEIKDSLITKLDEYKETVIREASVGVLNKITNEGGNFVLESDIIAADNYILIDKPVTIDLNGHNIFIKTRTNNAGELVNYGFVVAEGGELTINGDGRITNESANESNVVWAYGGKVTINGGYYENINHVDVVIYASKTGSIEINGGIFKAAFNDRSAPGTKDDYPVLNKLDADRDKCSINVKGGKFYGFDPGNNYAEGPDTNFLADGYVSVLDSDNYYVVSKE